MRDPLKPKALRPGDGVCVLSLASPVQENSLQKGCDEIARLGYVPVVDKASVLAHESFFAGSSDDRLAALKAGLLDPRPRAIFCSRGGYGSAYLLDGFDHAPDTPKILLGSSDITSLQIFLWQQFGWVTFYGPMVATNFDRGAGASHGYDAASLASALSETRQGWTIDLGGKPLANGKAEGVLLGGCLTIIETTLGTPWELDTRGAILVIEDRGMKPYQVDRSLLHLKQAGKFRDVAGIILGEFPDCQGTADNETVEDVTKRLLMPLGIPVVWGARVGHTSRAMLTLPLGVRAELSSAGGGTLRILEPACTA